MYKSVLRRLWNSGVSCSILPQAGYLDIFKFLPPLSVRAGGDSGALGVPPLIAPQNRLLKRKLKGNNYRAKPKSFRNCSEISVFSGISPMISTFKLGIAAQQEQKRIEEIQKNKTNPFASYLFARLPSSHLTSKHLFQKKNSKSDKMLSCKHLLGKLAKLEPPSCGQAGQGEARWQAL